MKKLINVAVVICMSLFVWACSSDSGGGGGGGSSSSSCSGSGTSAVVDVAVGDFNESQVYLFLDFFGVVDEQDYNRADVILDDACLNSPNDIRMHGGDLYVADQSSSSICIWRGYEGLSDSDAVSTTLAGAVGLISSPHRIFLFDDILVVADAASTKVFDAAASITGTDTTAPDANLTNGGTVTESLDVVVDDDGRMYIADGTTVAGDPSVLIYDSIDDVVANGAGGDLPADVTLNEDTSFLTIPSIGSSTPKRLLVSNDTLFVGMGYEDEQGGIFVFNGASSLGDDALPDVVILPGRGTLYNTTSMILAGPLGDTLIAGSGQGGNSCTGGDAASAVGFNQAFMLEDDQVPSFVIPDDLGIWHTQRLKTANGAVFQGGYTNCDFDEASLHVWFNSCSLDSIPDMILAGTESGDWVEDVFPFSSLQGLEAIVRE